MALEKLRYYVATSARPEPVLVQIVWADQLLAEREAHRHGITDKMGLHLTTYWCWAALTRMGESPGDFQPFMADPGLDIVPLEALKNAGAPTVDPTPPALPAGSLWPSPYSSESPQPRPNASSSTTPTADN